MNAAAHDDTGVDIDSLDPGEVHGLWIGERLSILAELCIRSFLYHGFRFKLFTYGPVENVPDGVAILDAGMILPANDAFVHKTGSLAPAADWFRYRFLHRHGGVWVDMDLICLKPFRIQRVPWFARENGSTVAIGLLAFPPGHELLREMERLAADPAAVMPWDTDEQARVKAELMRSMTGVAKRRTAVDWGSAGPGEFTRAVRHFGLLGHAAAPSSVYPVHYGVWRHLYDGTLRLDSPVFEQSFAIHLWGELTRREPDALANLAADSVVAGLMEQHGISLARLPSASPPEAGSSQRILVGVCSARPNSERRQAVRETWMSCPAENIEIVFFVGQGEHPLEDAGDVVAVQARDDYDHLPEKVQEFFRAALDRDFDWLFKCDDDTYVDLSRLHELAFRDYDLVGNDFIESRGAPSGGAGYFLTRRLAALLAADQRLPKTGAEDLIVGDAARVMGASLKGTRRLCWNTARFPQAENDVVTSHWCSPQRLRVIHEIRHSEASEVEAVHRHWRDWIKLFPSGSFTRCSTECSGTWTAVADGVIRLKWFSWPEESLVPEPASDTNSESLPRYRCVGRELPLEDTGGVRPEDARHPIFLIYGAPRSGTTRLCHELDARVPVGFRVFNEPFHPHAAVRNAYGSDCSDAAPDTARRWLQDRPDIAGIKLVANRADSVIANRYHGMFTRVLIINRDPIDIAISLEAATLTGQWNRGDGISKESNPPRVRVSLATMEKVREFLGNIETFRELRRASGLGGIKEITYDGVTEVGEAAAFLELPETRLRPPFREIRKMRTTESREERCSNLDEVVEFFRS
jgi:hypothetical protein